MSLHTKPGVNGLLHVKVPRRQQKSVTKISSRVFLIKGDVQNLNLAVNDLEIAIDSNLMDDRVGILVSKGLPLGRLREAYYARTKRSLDDAFPVQCQRERDKGDAIVRSKLHGYPVGASISNDGRCLI